MEYAMSSLMFLLSTDIISRAISPSKVEFVRVYIFRVLPVVCGRGLFARVFQTVVRIGMNRGYIEYDGAAIILAATAQTLCE